MKDWQILNEHELAHLENSSGDDCDMAAVRCVVRELRQSRAAALTADDVEGLRWLRDNSDDLLNMGAGYRASRPDQARLSDAARVALAKLLATTKGEP